MSFKVGQGIRYIQRGYHGYLYGVILAVSDVHITFAKVDEANRVLCYDDMGASYDKHRDNVRLKDCPLPFSDVSHGVLGGAYVYANIDAYIKWDALQCEQHHVEVIDDGHLISESIMNEILNHPWQEQPEKEKTRRVPSCFEEISNEYKRIYNPSESQLGD